ncbi:MAG: hypothetical protein GF355_11700 [Candidatus Eisenbacteria bacterium]|nr:hypothetical protein [Candidatus Eisenbacteria bacterium]
MSRETHWMQVWTRLKRLDPVLISARQSVELDLGWEGRLRGMELWTLYEVAWTGAGPRAPREVLEETTALANPNRELAWIRTTAEEPAPPGDREADWLWCLAWDREEPRAGHAYQVCRRLLAQRNMKCEEVVRAMVWGLSWTENVSDPRRASEDLARTRSRMQGLLVNPHVEAMQIVPGSVPFPWWPVHAESE